MPGEPFWVPANSLDSADVTFRSSIERPLEALRQSIRSVGVLYPIRVQAKKERFRIVSGFLRAESLLAEGVQQMPVVQHGEGESDDVLLLETLQENRFTRGFSWAERAWVLHRALEEWRRNRSWIMEVLMPAVDLHPAPKILEDHLQVHMMSEPVKRLLVQRGCSMANALRVCRWPPFEQEALIPLLHRLHLGENVLREILERLWEISCRDALSPSVFLAESSLREILEDEERDGPQRAEAFRSQLRKRRYPTLFSMEEAFRKAKASLRIPPELSLRPFPYFERAGVNVSFSARTADEFRRLGRIVWELSRQDSGVEDLLRATKDPPG